MKTRRNVYYNLEESPYITKFNEFRFSFSSKFYQNKFEESLLEYIEKESSKFKNYYNVNINLTDLLAFNLYSKIEKRGCYCIYKNNSLNRFVIKSKLNCIVQIVE
ncbi:MAG: early protein GP4 [Methanosphaera sp.]|nr:early protein GP4 [Methanosphaera sp.]